MLPRFAHASGYAIAGQALRNMVAALKKSAP